MTLQFSQKNFNVQNKLTSEEIKLKKKLLLMYFHWLPSVLHRFQYANQILEKIRKFARDYVARFTLSFNLTSLLHCNDIYYYNFVNCIFSASLRCTFRKNQTQA